jgi:hypothetical protein
MLRRHYVNTAPMSQPRYLVVASVTCYASYRNTPPTNSLRHDTASDDYLFGQPAVHVRLATCVSTTEVRERAVTAWSAVWYSVVGVTARLLRCLVWLYWYFSTLCNGWCNVVCQALLLTTYGNNHVIYFRYAECKFLLCCPFYFVADRLLASQG